MSRKTPPNPPEVKKDGRPGWVTEIRKYKVITPLYGGGEETQKADSVTTVRATEVRGHLRFWWRATRGGTFSGNLKSMKEAEEEIWGSPGEEKKPGPSKVIVTIVSANRGRDFQATDRNDNSIDNIGKPNSKDGYVAFPLRELNHPVLRENVEFTLQIGYPSHNDEGINFVEEVNSALRAWEIFGGIGARTRRGFGALQCVEVDGRNQEAPKMDEIRDHIQKQLPTGKKWPAGIPHLASDPHQYREIRRGANSNPIGVWRDLIGQLQSFRQDRNGRFGRSLWPEPDEIRRKTGDHLDPRHVPQHHVRKFPRGKFGLPIIFEFKREDTRAGDPKKTTLQGADHDRLASPLILRPIVCSDGMVGLAAILEWGPINSSESYTPPGGLLLTSKDYNDFPVESNLNAAEAAQIPPLNGEPNVLKAFLKFLK